MSLYIELTCIDMIHIYFYICYTYVLKWGNGGKPLDAGVPYFWTHQG